MIDAKTDKSPRRVCAVFGSYLLLNQPNTVDSGPATDYSFESNGIVSFKVKYGWIGATACDSI